MGLGLWMVSLAISPAGELPLMQCGLLLNGLIEGWVVRCAPLYIYHLNHVYMLRFVVWSVSNHYFSGLHLSWNAVGSIPISRWTANRKVWMIWFFQERQTKNQKIFRSLKWEELTLMMTRQTIFFLQNELNPFLMTEELFINKQSPIFFIVSLQSFLGLTNLTNTTCPKPGPEA